MARLSLQCAKRLHPLARTAAFTCYLLSSMLIGRAAAQTSQAEKPSTEAIRALLAHDNDAQAEALLRAGLAQNAYSAEWHFLLGYALFAEHKAEDSLSEYTLASHLGAPSPEDLRCVALDYVLLGDYADADHWLTYSLTANNANAEAWYDLGRVRYTEGQYESARDSFLRSLSLLPRSVKAEDNLGLAYQELHQPDEAIAAFRQAIAWQAGAEHSSEQPLLNLASLLADRDQLDEAVSLLHQALIIAPKNSSAHRELGILYSRQNDWKQSQTEFEQAVAADPENASLHFLLGRACQRLGDATKAHEEFAQAKALAWQSNTVSAH